MTHWITDANGNRCSVEYWGSEAAAKTALASLENCRDCTDCSRCTDCTDCTDRSRVAFLADRGRLSGGQPAGDDILGQPAIPKIENIHQRVLEAASVDGALDMSRWHTCGTTHCRAGWVVHLAGEAGYALERFHNTALAAQLIYRESDPENPVAPTRFYETNDEALADMRRLASLEAAT